MTDDQPNTVPLTRRPVFRWAVGVYFAVLLGGGTFVLPAPIHSRANALLGLDSVVADAFFAKLLLAAVAALLGLLIGLLIGGRITASARSTAVNENEAADLEPPALTYLGDSVDEAEDGDMLDRDATEAAEEAQAVDGESTRHRLFNPREHLAGEEVDPAPPSSPEPVDADFHEISEDTAPDMGHEQDWPEGDSRTELPGDLSLAQLTARLEAALAAHQAAQSADISTETPADERDPVVAFLRREAERPEAEGKDRISPKSAQASLRSALDRLSQVSKG